MNIRQQQNPKTSTLIDSENVTEIPICKVLPNKLIYYKLPAHYILQSDKKANSLQNLKIKKNNTQLLRKSASKLTDTVLYWAHASKIKCHALPHKLLPIKFRLVFITLTLPAQQKHSDTEIKKRCLNQFLTELREKFGVVNYCWKAELQKNGNIHFHIVTDVFVNHIAVREIWNRCVEKLGYVTQFENSHGHRNPNSTDIEAVRNSKQIGKYIGKYLSKSLQTDVNNGSEVIQKRRKDLVEYYKLNNIELPVSQNEMMMKGKKIAISENLNSKLSKFIVALGSVDDEIQKLVDCEGVTVFNGESVSVIQYDSFNLLRCNCPQLYGLLQEILTDYKSRLN